jgi:hypothetical protein
MTFRLAVRIATLLTLLALLGCSKPETVEVSGTVNWEGAPIPNGDIVFVPLDPHITPTAGKIIDGAYTFEAKPGEKRVEITSYRLSGKFTPAGKPIGEMYIPDRYNANSTLTTNVTLDGDNEFNFDLKP